MPFLHRSGTYTFKVRSYHIDLNGQLKTEVLFQFLQECAYMHAESNNFGFSFLRRNNQFWVLNRIKLNINTLPQWNDELAITTWPSGTEGLTARREFEIRLNNEVIISASSYWIIVDATTKRPVRPNNFEFSSWDFITSHAIEGDIERLRLSNIAKIDEYIIKASDLDVNKHTNNSNYVRMVLDNYSAEFLGNHRIKQMVVNFNSESFFGDILQISSSEMDHTHYFGLNRMADNKSVFTAGLSWKPL